MTAPKKLLLIFTACLLALCATLCVYAQCATSSDVISTSAVVRLFRSPELTLVGEQPYQLPSILYVGESERLSAELEEYYSPVIEILRGANSDGEIAHMQYELSEPSDGSNYLSAYIVADCGTVIHLPDVVISRSGEAVFSQMPDLGYLADSSFAGGYFRLMQRGVDVLPSRKEETVCLEDMCALMTGYYECMLGREVDISRFSDAESGKQYLKALELGLCGEYDSFTDDSEVTTTRLASSVQGLLERLSADVCGRSSQNVSLDDAVAVTRFFAQIYDLCGDEYYTTQRGRLDEIISNTDLAALASDSGIASDALTRWDIAALYVTIFEQIFGTVEVDDELISHGDLYDDYTKKAAYKLLMPDYPGFGIFSPTCDVSAEHMLALAAHFVDQCYWEWLLSLDEYIDSGMTYGDVVAALGMTDELLHTFEKPNTAEVIVDNSREYEWYLTQHDTGPFSDVNCMPTISAMAINWYRGADSSVTVEELRDRLLEKTTSGWYMSQVTDSLDAYGVPFEEIEDIREGIIRELDRGHIVLAQMSEKEIGESGHCFVIYGYRRLGGSVQFFLHDPDVSYDDNIYGEPAGKSMTLDSAYVYWIIERITYYIVSVGD